MNNGRSLENKRKKKIF